MSYSTVPLWTNLDTGVFSNAKQDDGAGDDHHNIYRQLAQAQSAERGKGIISQGKSRSQGWKNNGGNQGETGLSIKADANK